MQIDYDYNCVKCESRNLDYKQNYKTESYEYLDHLEGIILENVILLIS